MKEIERLLCIYGVQETIGYLYQRFPLSKGRTGSARDGDFAPPRLCTLLLPAACLALRAKNATLWHFLNALSRVRRFSRLFQAYKKDSPKGLSFLYGAGDLVGWLKQRLFKGLTANLTVFRLFSMRLRGCSLSYTRPLRRGVHYGIFRTRSSRC